MVTGSCAPVYNKTITAQQTFQQNQDFPAKTTNLLVKGGANTLRTGLKGNRAALLVFIISCLEGQYHKRRKKRVKFSAGLGLVAVDIFFGAMLLFLTVSTSIITTTSQI
jgi:hypothetical protein